MEEYFNAGDAGWTAQLNAVIQALTRAAYHVSGGKITPGSSSTNVTVTVEAGEAVVHGTQVSWPGEELPLEDGGVGPSGTDENLPRVDAVFAREDSTLGVATGEPAPFTPDTTPEGQPYTPAPMEHWTPAPDSGSRIGGCVLGFVLVGKNATAATDIPSENIQQWKIGTALDKSRLVFGDGTPNGPTTIAVNDDPLSIEDSARSSPQIFDYDNNDNVLRIGAAGVRVEGKSIGTLELDSNSGVVFDTTQDQNGVVNIYESKHGGSDRWALQTALGGAQNAPFSIRNLTTRDDVFWIDDTGTSHFAGNGLQDVKQVVFNNGAKLNSVDYNGHLEYTAPDGTKIDLTAGEGDLSGP